MSTGRPPNGPRLLPVGLMAIGSEMAGFTVLGVVLDQYVFGTFPWLTIGLTMLGFVAAFYHLLRFAKVPTRPSGSPPGQSPNGDER